LIVRLNEHPDADIPALCADFDIPPEVGERALRELEDRGLVANADGSRIVTPTGVEIARRLVAERRASLARRCEGWSPEDNAELDTLLSDLAHDLARQPAREVAVPA
jgi:DNA-binding MarR family transcriptional regulator